jgi:hypothetical protein
LFVGQVSKVKAGKRQAGQEKGTRKRQHKRETQRLVIITR